MASCLKKRRIKMKSWKDIKAETTTAVAESAALPAKQAVPAVIPTVIPTVLTSFDSSWDDANWETPEIEARDNSFIDWDNEVKVGETFCGLLLGLEEGNYGRPNIILQDKEGNVRKTTLSAGMRDYEKTLTEMAESGRKDIMVMFLYEKSVATKNGKNCRLFRLKFREVK